MKFLIFVVLLVGSAAIAETPDDFRDGMYAIHKSAIIKSGTARLDTDKINEALKACYQKPDTGVEIDGNRTVPVKCVPAEFCKDNNTFDCKPCHLGDVNCIKNPRPFKKTNIDISLPK